ncbi:MAG: EamA family transporter [Ornithinimicrobium sp.]|uniref:EamA family transporter n=1 Tax=Ornithinimicrobium sp. TaxID=1977084 RepID=UPI0026E094E9|nr:EamA family transporter [Ornithinimicrobium sp.]MDO5738983.1 EamA family transporter [Ornithinimicrobium sp.]
MTATSTRKATTMSPRETSSRETPSAQHVLLVGLLLAVVSAATFGTAGAVAKSSLVQGWSPAAAVTVRISVGALILAVPTARAMRGRWQLLSSVKTWVQIGLFGTFAVGGCQLFYFLAVRELSVAVALMIEYLGPILVVAWLWLANGHRPRRLTMIGMGLAILGLVLILDVLGDVQVSTLGVLFGLGAAVGLAIFFVIGADDSNGLPPIAFACLGMAVGAVMLLLVGMLQIVPFEISTTDAVLAGVSLPWWVPLIWLGIVAAAIAYVTGIAANRRLGAKVASFVGLTEVMFAVLWAWLLLGEMPATIQLLGGLLILVGVIAVKLDEAPDEPHIDVPSPVLPAADANS